MFSLNKLDRFRIIAFFEGISYLLLLFIAMPIKYMMGEPLVVKYIGMIHGILFLAFIYAQIDATLEKRWSVTFNALAFISSLIPFGTFVLERKLDKIAIEK
ncbi:MAG: DUF3817 domain-containing protein [Campylobacterota bacterium]